MSNAPEGTASAELDVADSIGQLMEFWGFKRPMGRIWALLYLSPTPLGAAEIGERLRMSAGAVSMAIGELVKWGAIKRAWRPGERREYYEAETNVGRLVQRVLRERELSLVRTFGEVLDSAQAALSDASTGADEVQAFKHQRLRELRRLSRLGELLLTALVDGRAVDPSPILKVYTGR